MLAAVVETVVLSSSLPYLLTKCEVINLVVEAIGID